MIDAAQVQTLLLSSYRDLAHAAFLPLRADGGADFRGVIEALLPSVTFGRKSQASLETAGNLALSYAGLQKLGLEDQTLRGFSIPFKEGMAGSDRRSEELGDVGDAAPTEWRWGGPRNDPVHAILLLYAKTLAGLAHEIGTAKAAAAARGLTLVTGPLEGSWPSKPGVEGLREHFGFVDGISQPELELGGGSQSADSQRSRVADGELVLGYPNERNVVASGPTVSQSGATRRLGLRLAPGTVRCDLGVNGTYVVLRQLEQHVLDFWRFAKAHAGVVGSTELCGAKLMGRWRNGAPLTLQPGAPASLSNKVTDNDFDFRHDQDDAGLRCPLGAHIRRANPRDALPGAAPRESLAQVRRHRILRRGRPYGTPVEGWPDPETMLAQAAGSAAAGDRGVYFLCINADISAQFEHVQQLWLNNPTFVSPARDEVDPIVGRPRAQSRFLVPRTPTPVVLGEHGVSLGRFTTMRGGGYFFLPSERALRYFAATDR